MNFKDMLDKLSMLSEGTKETPTGRIHKAEPGGYGRKYDTDEEGEEKDGEKDAKKPAEKRGRGRPTKTGAHVSSPAEKKKQQEKEKASKDLQSFIVGNVPKKSKELEKLPKKKHSLKEFFDQIDNERMIREAEQISIEPASTSTHVIRQGTKTLGTVSNPQLAQQIKQSIGKGEMSFAGDKLGEEGLGEEKGEKWIQKAIDPSKKGALRKKLGAKEGEPIPAGKLAKATHSKDPTTARQARLAQTLRKINKEDVNMMEVEQPTMDNMSAMGAGLGAGRSNAALEEAKKTVKKDDKAEVAGKKVAKDIEYDEKVKDKIHGKKRHAEDEKAEKAGKKVAKDIEYDEKKDKKKKTMKEGMSHKLAAARLEGKSHGLRGHAHNGKHYEDMEEARAYHEGYKEGLDECYGMMPIRGVVVGEDPMPATVPGMASAAMPAMEAPLFPKLRTDGVTKKASAWLNDPKLQTQVQALKGTGYLAPNDPSKGLRQDPQAPRDMQDPVDFELTNPMYFAAYLTRVIKKLGDINITGIVEPGMTMEAPLFPKLRTDGVTKKASAWLNDPKLQTQVQALKGTGYLAPNDPSKGLRQDPQAPRDMQDPVDFELTNPMYFAAYLTRVIKKLGDINITGIVEPGMTMEDEMEEGNLFTGNLAKARAAGKKFADLDSDGDMEKVTEFAFEAWDKELNSLLTESEEVNEGMTVSISKGQQGAPDSVSVSAQDAEAEKLLSFIKQAGLGIFADDAKSDYGSPELAKHAHGNIEVVDDHDGMMSLMKKMTGAGDSDYKDEEHHSDHDHDEETCNECGYMESSCKCDEEMVEDKSYDQEEEIAAESDELAELKRLAGHNVAQPADDSKMGMQEDNPPDSGAKDTEIEVQDTAQANASATDKEMTFGTTMEGGDGGEASEEEIEEDVTESVKLDEWANDAGKRGTETTFITNDEFMLDTISSGLNKKKVTGQTTIPVIAGQDNRMGNDDLVSWKKLAGLK